MATPTSASERPPGDVTERVARTTLRRFGLALLILAVHVEIPPLDPDRLLTRVRTLVGPLAGWHDALATLFAVPDQVWPEEEPADGDPPEVIVATLARIARAVIDWHSAQKEEEFFAGQPLPALLDMALRGWTHEPWVVAALLELEVLTLTADRPIAADARAILKAFYRQAFRSGRGNVTHAEEPKPSTPNPAGRLVTDHARALQQEIEQLIAEGVAVTDAVEGVKERVEREDQYGDVAHQKKVFAKVDQRLVTAGIVTSPAMAIAVANARRKLSPK